MARRLLFWGALSAAIAVTVIAPLVIAVVGAFAQSPRGASVAAAASSSGVDLSVVSAVLSVLTPIVLIAISMGASKKTAEFQQALLAKMETKQETFAKEIHGKVDAAEARLDERTDGHREKLHEHDRRIDRVAGDLKAHRDNPQAHKVPTRGGPYQGSDSDIKGGE